MLLGLADHTGRIQPAESSCSSPILIIIYCALPTAAFQNAPQQALHLPCIKVNLWNLADAVLDVGKAFFSHFFYMFIYTFIIYHLEWIMHLTHDLSMLFIRYCSST
jgi:hypothetical protein